MNGALQTFLEEAQPSTVVPQEIEQQSFPALLDAFGFSKVRPVFEMVWRDGSSRSGQPIELYYPSDVK